MEFYLIKLIKIKKKIYFLDKEWNEISELMVEINENESKNLGGHNPNVSSNVGQDFDIQNIYDVFYYSLFFKKSFFFIWILLNFN